MEPRRFRLSLLDAVVLLYHIHRGVTTEGVGFEDANKTLQQLTRSLSQFKYTVTEQTLESALWSCNLMDEQGEWWSPEGDDFDTWLKRFLADQHLSFDKFYNVLIERKKNVTG
jgi:hypothetical protein